MRKSIFFTLILCGFFFLIACDKIFLDVEGSEADLQGKWQMNSADTVYYNFQKYLFQYQIYLKKDSILSVEGYYTLYGDTSIDIELIADRMNINNSPTTAYSLNFLGWDTLHPGIGADTLFRTFQVKKLEKGALILSHMGENYTFRKF